MGMTQDKNGGTAMTPGEHFETLRRRVLWALAGLVVALVVTMVFGREVQRALVHPYDRMMAGLGEEPSLAVLSMPGGLMLYFRVCLYAALVLAAPWILYQAWMFTSSGLYDREKRTICTAVPFSAALFVGGALFFVFTVSLPMLQFFHAFNAWLGVKEVITLESHIRFMTNMMLAFGLGFQMPLVVLVLAKVGLVTVGKLNHYRRHAIVGILIFAAIFTSPSPFDQVLLAIPMWLLFELGVGLVYFFVERGKRQEQRA